MASISDADEAALRRSIVAPEPMGQAAAGEVLRETKDIFDELGVVFFLRQGTCLGAIREQGFAKAESYDHYVWVPMVKSSIRIDWMCFHVFDDNIFHWPGSGFPVRLFTHLKEIDFAGGKFLVPDPPEEYLQFKYGPHWKTPKRTGYEKDVVQMIPEAPIPERAGTLKQLLITRIPRRPAGRLRVLDHDGEPVAGTEVAVAGLNRSRTNSRGYVRFFLPCDDYYALTVRHGDHEEVLYEEKMAPGETYVYRPDPAAGPGRFLVLTQE